MLSTSSLWCHLFKWVNRGVVFSCFASNYGFLHVTLEIQPRKRRKGTSSLSSSSEDYAESTARLITMTTYFRFTASFIYWRFLFTSSCKPNVEGKAGHWLAALLSIFHHVWCSINMLTAHVISLFNIFGLSLCGPGLPVFIIRDIPWVCSIYHLSWWSNGILLFFL